MKPRDRILCLIFFLFIVIFCTINFRNNIITDNTEIKKLEATVLKSSNKKTNQNTPKFMFEDSLKESDLINLPKGAIFLVFSPNCTKDEAKNFIDSLDKRKYLGVIGDMHFIQLNTTEYEELFRTCYDLMQNDLISVAYVNQLIFDNTLTEDDVDALKGKNVIYYQLIPSGKEANIAKFLTFTKNLKGGEYIGTYKNSVFIQYKNASYDELTELCNNISYPEDDHVLASIHE